MSKSNSVGRCLQIRITGKPLEDLLPPVRCHQITSLSDDEEWKVALLDAIAGQDDLIEMIDIAKNLYQSLRSRLNLIRAGVLSKAANKYLLNQVGQTYIRFETFCHETDFSPRTPDYLYFLENPIDKKCASEEGAKDMKEMKRIIWEQVALVNPVLAKMYIQCLEIAAFWNQMEDIRHDLQREEL